MMNRLYIANWKISVDYAATNLFLSTHYKRLQALAFRPGVTFGMAPTLLSLPLLQEKFSQSPLVMVGQNCSQFSYGPYTGEVSAYSLAQVGCSFCLVGHSERRHFFYETEPIIVKKIINILQAGMTPIICVGESWDEKEQGLVTAVLKKQLSSFIEVIVPYNIEKIYIAYEPHWAIGTNKIPSVSELQEIAQIIKKIVDPFADLCLLYGGGISTENSMMLQSIKEFGGFLLGNVSHDMQDLEKIVI